MIRSFADKTTEELFDTGKSRKVPADVWRRALWRLQLLDKTRDVQELRQPLSNRLHVLQGDRKGQYSIAVNDQWRICFRFENEDAYDVEFCDYH